MRTIRESPCDWSHDRAPAANCSTPEHPDTAAGRAPPPPPSPSPRGRRRSCGSASRRRGGAHDPDASGKLHGAVDHARAHLGTDVVEQRLPAVRHRVPGGAGSAASCPVEPDRITARRSSTPSLPSIPKRRSTSSGAMSMSTQPAVVEHARQVAARRRTPPGPVGTGSAAAAALASARRAGGYRA